MALTSEDIQELLKQAQKESSGCNSHQWDIIIENIWSHLVAGFKIIDDQLLCSTCFYTVLKHLNNQDRYLKKILNILNENLSTKRTSNGSKTVGAVSLMYGLLQSAYLTKDTRNLPVIINEVLKSALALLIRLGYEYSRYTFIVFKTLNSLKKVCGTILQDYLLNNENVTKLLNLVNHNWENPITGVRELNRTIFKTLLTIIEPDRKHKLLEQVNSFYWNKAKYLMLSVFIEQSHVNIVCLVKDNNWIQGLTYSLQKPGLVSAGADMYFAILKKLKSTYEWTEIFLSQVLKVMLGSNRKEIEHISNYWYLTTFKVFPSLAALIKENLENDLDDIDEVLYSYLYLVTKANKLGLIQKNWLESGDKFLENAITKGLDHCDTAVRILAFDVICVTQGKSISSEVKCRLILEFVKNNISSDCTVLRIHMIAGFKLFFKQYTTLIKSCQKMENYQIKFVHDVNKLINTSLDLNGNYQRKIATLKISDVYLNNVHDLPQAKGWLVLDQNDEASPDVNFCKLLNLLEDPAEDVRENAKQLLYDYYVEGLNSPMMMNSLLDKGLQSMESKFFYKIICSQTIIKLITKILCTRGFRSTKFRTVEELFDFVYKQFIDEITSKRDIVESIENGRQLHSFIGILQVILEVCYKERYNIIITSETVIQLIEALEEVSNQFVWEYDTATSSDFSKMSDMVRDMIQKSSFNQVKLNDTDKISGLEQIVLNCLWLNVKASCDMASFMIKFQTENTLVCQKSLLLITHVLEKSRHKGAIEAAGAALVKAQGFENMAANLKSYHAMFFITPGQAIQYLTSLPEENCNSDLPFKLLKCKLQELISETNKMASTTRRGAGLSIMVHRIVSGDVKKGKPLFHYFMRNLLGISMKTEDMPEKSSNPDIDNEKDLPKAIYIHFLTRVVTDSSLSWDGMYYSTELAELAFDNLTSPHWQIRNAALQLYGALVPKLIGQKKASGVGNGTIATVACDEFITHSPKLWVYMNKQLKCNDTGDKVLAHSNLVPILNIFANIARRYNLTDSLSIEDEFGIGFLQDLVRLLGSPIYKVRQLAALSIYNIYTFPRVCDVVLKNSWDTENLLHGVLMLLKYFVQDITDDQEAYKQLEDKFKIILSCRTHSYLNHTLYEDIFEIKLDLKVLKDTLLEADNNKHSPGVDVWAKKRLERFLQGICFQDLAYVVDIILSRNDYEENCKYLLTQLENVQIEQSEKSLATIAQKLLKFPHCFTSEIVWNMLYKISKRTNLQTHIETQIIVKTDFTLDLRFKIRYIIPFLIRTCIESMILSEVISIAEVVNSLSDSEVDVNMRQVAAHANNELAEIFPNLPDSAKIFAIKTAITLLQDEDEDVRNISVHFYKNITCGTTAFQPYITLQKILQPCFFISTMEHAKSSVEQLSKYLSDLITSMSVTKKDDYNPFANDLKNVYFEGEVLQQLLMELNQHFENKQLINE